MQLYCKELRCAKSKVHCRFGTVKPPRCVPEPSRKAVQWRELGWHRYRNRPFYWSARQEEYKGAERESKRFIYGQHKISACRKHLPTELFYGFYKMKQKLLGEWNQMVTEEKKGWSLRNTDLDEQLRLWVLHMSNYGVFLTDTVIQEKGRRLQATLNLVNRPVQRTTLSFRNGWLQYSSRSIEKS